MEPGSAAARRICRIRGSGPLTEKDMQRTLITAALVAASAAALAMPERHGANSAAQGRSGCGAGMADQMTGEGTPHEGRMSSMQAMRAQRMQAHMAQMQEHGGPMAGPMAGHMPGQQGPHAGQLGQPSGPGVHRHNQPATPGQPATPAPLTTP